MNLYKLQNGTDIRGVAVENPQRELSLSEREVEAIATGFVKWIYNRNNTVPRIAVGNDSRVTADLFRSTILSAMEKMGVEALDCEMATTPAMFMTTVLEDFDCDGSIMITASHMPYFYNGLKFFDKRGGLNKSDVKEILDIAVEFLEEKESDKGLDIEKYTLGSNGSIRRVDLISKYSGVLRDYITENTSMERPFEGMKIIVDAGNGAGGFFAEKVLAQLGADTEGSQLLNPDGMFPNHIPNPENKEAMKSISEAVKNTGADVGIIFDTDVDRAAIVGKDGSEINKNALIALIGAIILEEHPGSYIVTDSVTSRGLKEFIEAKGGVHHRFKRGYKNVINEAIRLNEEGKESHLAIETSGHAAIKESYFLDDGSFLIAKLLVKAALLKKEGLTLADLIKDLKEPLESEEMRLEILEEDFKGYGELVLNELRGYVATRDDLKEVENNYEGVRVDVEDGINSGWFLVRISLHEPLLVINIEADNAGGAAAISDIVKGFLKDYKLK